jgi:hypothetical protein
MKNGPQLPHEIEVGHVVLATILTLVACAWTGVIVFADGDSLAEFIVTWFLSLAAVWTIARNSEKS